MNLSYFWKHHLPRGLSLVALAVSPLLAEPIRIQGSDTLLILNSEWANQYQQANRSASILVIGGGSEQGFEALLRGETDIAAASRPIRPEEIKKIEASTGAAPLEIPVAMDGIAIYVHDSNPLHYLKMDQVKGIFTGKISNWKELGGPDRPIHVVSRNIYSGTTTFFRAHALGGEDIIEDALMMGTTSAVVMAVERMRDSIGFGGVAYGSGSRIVRLIPPSESKPIWPTKEDVANGTYPLSRTLYYYLHPGKKNEPEIIRFIQWVQSEPGQKIAERLYYYPLPSEAKLDTGQP